MNDVKHEMNEVMVACFNDSFKRAKREGKRADVVLWSMESISGVQLFDRNYPVSGPH